MLLASDFMNPPIKLANELIGMRRLLDFLFSLSLISENKEKVWSISMAQDRESFSLNRRKTKPRG